MSTISQYKSDSLEHLLSNYYYEATPIMKLLPLCFLLLSSLTFSAEVPDYSNYLGTYDGFVMERGLNTPLVLSLEVIADGRLRGLYIVKSEMGNYEGILSNPKISNLNTVVFEWTDKDGEGFQEMIFSNDFSSFSGFWGNYGSPEKHLISGKKR